MWARIHLIPLLQAEADRDLVRRHWAEQGREKELMGVETKVYHSDRYLQQQTCSSLENRYHSIQIPCTSAGRLG